MALSDWVLAYLVEVTDATPKSPVSQRDFEESQLASGEIAQAALSLSIGFLHLRAEGAEPFSVPLNDRRAAISHAQTLQVFASPGNHGTHLKVDHGHGTTDP